MRELHCPNCGAPFVRVTHQEGGVERLLSHANVFPFRCQLCTNRFRAIYSGGISKKRPPIDTGRTEQAIAVSIWIVSSSTVGFKTNSIKAPFGNPAVC